MFSSALGFSVYDLHTSSIFSGAEIGNLLVKLSNPVNTYTVHWGLARQPILLAIHGSRNLIRFDITVHVEPQKVHALRTDSHN